MTSRYISTEKRRPPKPEPVPAPEVLAFSVGEKVWWCVNTRRKVYGTVTGHALLRVRVRVDQENRDTLVDPLNLRRGAAPVEARLVEARRLVEVEAMTRGVRTEAGGFDCCPRCGQREHGFLQTESGITAVRAFLFNGAEGEIVDTEFEHSRHSVTGKCGKCGHRFRVMP